MTDSPDVLDWQVLGFLQRIVQERDNPPLSDEACRTLETSRERLETSLEVLARLGFVTSNPDTPLGYEVVPTQPPIHDLTPQQVPVVDAIANLRERLGHPPTFREIGEESGRSLTPIFTQRIGPRSAAGDPPHIPSLATDRTLAGRWVHDTVADCWVRQAVTMH